MNRLVGIHRALTCRYNPFLIQLERDLLVITTWTGSKEALLEAEVAKHMVTR